jgi:hypothetical protein
MKKGYHQKHACQTEKNTKKQVVMFTKSTGLVDYDFLSESGTTPVSSVLIAHLSIGVR